MNGASIVLVVADVGIQLSNYLEGSATETCTVTMNIESGFSC